MGRSGTVAQSDTSRALGFGKHGRTTSSADSCFATCDHVVVCLTCQDSCAKFVLDCARLTCFCDAAE
eukprot:2206793-Amphidinium_carterae.1